MKQCKNDKLTKISKSDSEETINTTKLKKKKKREKESKILKAKVAEEPDFDHDFNVAESSQNDLKDTRKKRTKHSVVSKPSTDLEPNENINNKICEFEKKAAKKQRQKQKKKLRTELNSKASDHKVTVVSSETAINNATEKQALETGSSNVLNEYKKVDLKSLEEATIFVGNLPINTKRVQLARLLKEFGPVKSIRLRTAGGKRFFSHKQRKEATSLNAYVVLQDAQSADRAIALNGIEFKSNHLRITKSNSKNQIENAKVKNTIFVGNLKYSTTEENLREIFSSCGEIEYVRCIRDGDKGCKGVAYICFKKPEAVGLALELNETLLDERPIHVERYSIKKLGAKKVRDSASKGITKANAKKRLERKDKKLTGTEKKNALENGTREKNKTKFHGVKIRTIKKEKSKKPSKQQIKLARKIAPKIK